MRVLLAVHSSNPGGCEVCFDRALRHLAASPGFEVAGVYPDGTWARSWDSVAPHWRCAGSLPPSFSLRGYAGWAVRQGHAIRQTLLAIEEFKPDWVVVASSVMTGPVAAANRVGVPCLVYVREAIEPQSLRRALWRWLGARATHVVAVSRYLRDELGESGVAEPVLIPDGVALPQEPAWPGEGAPVSFFGGFAPVKGGEVFLRAASRIRTVRPQTTFRFCGKASPRQIRERQRLMRLASSLGVLDAVDFDESSDFDALIADSSVVAVPSFSEGLGLVALQAMAAGIPVVASGVGGLRDTVGRAGGRLVPAGDDAGFAEAVLALLKDPESAARIGREGRELVEREYSLQRSLESLERLLRGECFGR